MKVVIRDGEYEDYRYWLQIEIDGKLVFDVCDGEPEDNNLSRNFNDCYNIGNMLKKAWEAGRRGEEFEIECIEEKEM